MQIRAAKESDISSIAEVHVASSHHTYEGLFPKNLLDNMTVAVREKAWREWMPTPNTFTRLADLEGRVIGFSNFGSSRDEGIQTDNVGELYSVYVLPSALAAGVGYALTEDALETMRREGYSVVTLWVLDTNDRARKFYERQGFVLDGAKKTSEHEGKTLIELRYLIGLG